MKFTREWAMPSSDTFSCKPIGDFVRRYLAENPMSVDPFARNCTLATYTNDLNPDTQALYHMDAEAFLKMLKRKHIDFRLGIMDPPYSPRQIMECYKGIGKKVGMKETQSALLYARVRDALDQVMAPNGIVLSFGWNSVGMGKKRKYEIVEILLVCFGGAHYDTICMAERKIS